MFNLQKQGYQDVKFRINTVITSLRKQGSTLGNNLFSQKFDKSLPCASRGQPTPDDRRHKMREITSLRKQGSTPLLDRLPAPARITSLRKQGSTCE